MKRFGFQIKLSMVFIVFTVLILIITTYFVYQATVIQQKEELRSRILDLAKFASMAIDGDKHSQIKPIQESQGTTIYKEIKEVLENIRNIDPIIDNVYTMIKTDKKNIWMFIVDSGDTKGIIAYCGERYDASHIPQTEFALKMPIVDKKLNMDRWGIWLSGYAPIYNSQKQVVAVVGLDVSAQSIQEINKLLIKRFFWALLFGIILSLLMGWIISKNVTQSLHSLIMGVREVTQGNLEKKVHVRSKDEIQELAVAFNKMTSGLKETQDKLQRHYLNTIKSLVQAIEAKDTYTRGHSERVMRYAVDVAKRLGFPKEEIKLLEDICILHDIGKIGISERILTKPMQLSDEEWATIKKHPTIGEDILKHIEYLKPGLSIVRDHHERPDGKGYPKGLNKNEISLIASVVAVADAFDAMTSDRPYRKAFSKKEAIAILRENKGKQFDEHIVEIFITTLG